MERENLSKKAYKYLLTEILKNNFKMGDPISEVKIAKELQISRSPVREAIRQLEAEGIVKNLSSRGTFVAEFTIQDIYELFELRKIFEIQALKDSFPRLNSDVLKEMKNKIEKLNIKEIQPEKFYKIDAEFHSLFINLCGNTRLISFYNQLIKQLDIVRRISAKNPKHFEVSKKFHLQILDALIDQNKEKAIVVLQKHLENVQHETEIVLMLKD